MNKLHESLFGKGLVIVGVTGGEAAEIGTFVESKKMAYPVAIGGMDPGAGYDHKSIPYAVLIDPDGNVTWFGHPKDLDDDKIAAAMEGARPAYLAAGLEEVEELQQAGKPGASYAKAKELLAAGTLALDAQQQARTRVDAAEAAVGAAVNGALAAAADGDFYGAFALLDPTVANYGGVPRADDAASKLAELLADKTTKREIDAGKAHAAAAALAQEHEYDDAYEAFKTVSGKYRNTRAGRLAKAAADAIKTGGQLGFMRGCGACEAADKACPLHGKKRRKKR